MSRSFVSVQAFLVVGCALALFASAIGAVAFPACAHAASETYVLMADTHLGLPNNTAYQEVEDALYWADSLDNLKAVAVAGDLTDRGDEVAYSEWEFLFESILGSSVRRIQAMGDHDTGLDGAYLRNDPKLTVEHGRRGFLDINGGALTSYRTFANANIMTIGGVRAKGYSLITNGMLKQLDSRLKQTARQGKMAIVVCHYPYYYYAINMRAKLMGVLRSYPGVIYVSGHLHEYSRKAQCQSVKPSCSRTPYDRGGFNEKTKYAIRSIGVNALSSYRGGNNSYADSLTIDNGRIVVRKWNLSKEKVDRTWTFKQSKSAVVVKAAVSYKGKKPAGRFTYRVTFSDRKSYGGVKSGGVFSLRAGKVKRFSGVPSGVLVTVRAIGVPSGWTKAKTKAAEVTKSTRTVTMTSKKKKGAGLKAARTA